MSFFIYAAQKEKTRIEYMLSKYLQQLKSLSRGSITVKRGRTNSYYYLKYRDGKKAYTDYLGKEGDRVQHIRTELEKRKHIEAMIVHLRNELSLVNKVLEET